VYRGLPSYCHTPPPSRKLSSSVNHYTADHSSSQGYAADHPDIELLRLRDYTIGRKITDEEVLGDEGLDRIAALLACIKPFVSFHFHHRLPRYACGGFCLGGHPGGGLGP